MRNSFKLLLALLAAMLVSVSASAYDAERDGIYYNFDTSAKTAEVTYKDNNYNSYSGSVSIPPSVYFYYTGQEYSVTSIGNYAFCDCTGLTAVNIPQGVTSIGSHAFKYCKGLTAVNIPQGVTTIGEYAFNGCFGLTSVTIPSSVTSIGNSAFYSCTGLTSITIPEGVTSIESSAFKGCFGLTSVTIPSSVTSIGADAFCDCTGLTAVNIPQGVTSIKNNAFACCLGLASITLPSSVTSIGDCAFRGCGLTSIMVAEGNTTYDSRENCNAIIETSTNRLVAGCRNTIVPESVTSIGNEAFETCNGLTSITIPSSVTSIGECAFFGCNGLTSITIPSSVTSIGTKAFTFCSNLTSVTVENPSPVAISSSTFTEHRNATLYVPAGSKEAYEAADYWKEFKEIVEMEPAPEDVNKLLPTDITACIGGEVILPIEMENADEISLFQLDLTLPEGVSVAVTENGLLRASLSNRSADHRISSTKLENGSYRFAVYSGSNLTFSGNEGVVMNITLSVADDVEAGDYEVKLSNIELTTKDKTAILPADTQGTLTLVAATPGDVNGDGSVSITDIGIVIDHILEAHPKNFIFTAADLNSDGRVSITDVGYIIDLILGQSPAGVKERRPQSMNQDEPQEHEPE